MYGKVTNTQENITYRKAKKSAVFPAGDQAMKRLNSKFKVFSFNKSQAMSISLRLYMFQTTFFILNENLDLRMAYWFGCELDHYIQ